MMHPDHVHMLMSMMKAGALSMALIFALKIVDVTMRSM